MARRCSAGMITQSVVFPRRWGVAKAQRWLQRHGLKATKVDRTASTLRFRQVSPRICHRGNFATIPMGRTGIRKVICCPR